MSPYKKKRRHLHTAKKQFKMIESRLMEISIKIDNYIYKNKPILLRDAALCIEEVSSYKYQYGKDPRIFQVTEKLIRQLKGVIEEQDTTYSWNVQEVIENSMAVCSSSPTYSEREITVVEEQDPLCNDNVVDGDEFRKGGKQDNAFALDLLCDGAEAGRDESKKGDKENNAFASDLSLMEPMAQTNVTIASDSHEQNIGKRMDNRINRGDTIDLRDVDSVGGCNIIPVTNAQISMCNSPIKGIERSLSQLAINTVNKEQQSIISLRSIRKVSKESTYYNQTGLEMPSSYDRKYHHQYKTVTTEINEVTNGTVPIETIPNNKTIRKIQQNEDTLPQNKPQKKRRERKKAVAKQIELNDSSKEKPKRRRKSKPLNTPQNSNIKVNDTKSECTRVSKNNIFLSNSLNEVPLNFQSDPIRTIYSNNVVNDLSWLENIRYIREVAPEEIDSKLKYYDDSFWDTFDLPANWNDQDFL